MTPALLIMAAGLGSRFGGIKQIEHVGPHGEILMDYSIYDAVRSGFKKLIFVIKEDIYEDVKELSSGVISMLEKQGYGPLEICFAVQSFDDVPEFYTVPTERTKPLGTVHAVLAARDHIREPFLVVNADDYYGPEAYRSMYESVISLPENEASMAGYSLGVTLSPTGGVTRGICAVDSEGYLESVTETYDIRVDGDKIVSRNGGELTADLPVSMNVWGMRSDIIPFMQEYFELHLKNLTEENKLTKECLLPEFVDWMIKNHSLKVKAVQSGAAWLGLTCRADVPPVEAALLKLSSEGNYPPLC